MFGKAIVMGPQIRAARALLGWTAEELGKRAGVSREGVRNAERSMDAPNVRNRTLIEIQRALEEAGIVFLGSDHGDFDIGVAIRKTAALAVPRKAPMRFRNRGSVKIGSD